MFTELLTQLLGRNDLKGNYIFYDLKEYIRKFAKIEKELGNQFTDLFTLRHYPKNHILLNEGKVSRHLYFLIKGSVVMSNYDEKGNEILFHFFKPGEFITLYPSAIKKTLSKFTIYLYEDAKLLEANWEKVQKLADKHPVLHQLQEEIVADFMDKIMDKLQVLLTCKADERFQYLHKTDPYTFKKIKRYKLCTYLGIKKETLSRVSKKIK